MCWGGSTKGNKTQSHSHSHSNNYRQSHRHSHSHSNADSYKVFSFLFFVRKTPWSKERNLDRPHLQNLGVQMTHCTMNHLSDLILDRLIGRWFWQGIGQPRPNITANNRNFGQPKCMSKFMFYKRSFGWSKSMITKCNIGLFEWHLFNFMDRYCNYVYVQIDGSTL